jgi:electron transport complex protein RnfA
MLIIFSVFNMNLMLQCALGLNGAVSSKNHDKILALIKLSVIFISIILLWFLLSRIIFLTVSWIFIYVLLFPVSYIVYDGLEFLLFRYIIKKENDEYFFGKSSNEKCSIDECFISFPGGITAVAVFICLNIANGILEVLILSFGFSAGILLVSLIIIEIRKRAALEEVPRFLRGKPLVLISMGMLSLVFSVGSLLLLRMINFK